MSRKVLDVRKTVAGHEYGCSLAQLRAQARVAKHVFAVVPGVKSLGFPDDGRVAVALRSGRTIYLGKETDEARWAEQARQLAEERKPRVVYRRAPTLAEMYAEQKALELELAHENGRRYLKADEEMRAAARRARAAEEAERQRREGRR